MLLQETSDLRLSNMCSPPTVEEQRPAANGEPREIKDKTLELTCFQQTEASRELGSEIDHAAREDTRQRLISSISL